MRTNCDYLSEEFYAMIDKMALADLEALTIGMADNMACNAQKIEVCLSQRKHLLNNQFECSELQVARFTEIMSQLKEYTQTIFNATKQLYAQLYKNRGKDVAFADFTIETSLRVDFFDEEFIVTHPDSSYYQMADIIDSYYMGHWGGNLVDQTIDYDHNLPIEKLDDRYFEEQFRSHFDYSICGGNWGSEWLENRHPLLTAAPICYAAHWLIDHSLYSLDDIVRIRGFDRRLTVTYDW